MPKFTIAWLVVYFGGMLTAFINPLYGVLAYLFEYYLRPRHHWWGNSLPEWRWNFLVASVAILAYLLRRGSLRELQKASNPALIWLLCLAGSMAVVTAWAADPLRSWEDAVAFAKLALFYGLIVGNVRSILAFDAFMAVHIAGAGWWGWEAYLDPSRTAGRLQNVGSSDTLNDNLAAAHLLTVVPIACVYLLTSSDKRLRMLSFVTLPFIINTFILCNSRGATVGLAAAMIVALIAAKSRHRIRMLGAAMAIGVVFYALSDQTFIDRQRSINDEDAGAERLQTWEGAVRLLKDHPLGVGGGGFEYLSPVYIPGVVAAHDGELRNVHNTWLLILTEWGVQGFVLFSGFLWGTLVMLRRIRQRAGDDGAMYYRSLALMAGLVGTLTAATFSSRFLGESIYWLCALSFALYRVQAHELNLNPASTAAASSAADPGFRPATAAAR